MKKENERMYLARYNVSQTHVLFFVLLFSFREAKLP